MELDELMKNYRPSANDLFINISLIWNLAQYDNELQVLKNTAGEPERYMMRIGHDVSDSHTSYLNFELMPQQSREIKQARSDRAVEDLYQELQRELPQLIESHRPEAMDLWWFNDDQVEILRYTPPTDSE